MSANDLLIPGAESADWANLFVRELVTNNVIANSITSESSLVCNGQITADTIVSNGNIVALRRIEGLNLVIIDDRDLAVTWVNNTVLPVNLIETDTLKGTISINMNNVAVGADNFFTIRIVHPAISTNSRLFVNFTHDNTIMTNANYLLYSNNFSVATDCEPGFAQLLIRNCAVGPTNLGGSYLNYQFLIC